MEKAAIDQVSFEDVKLSMENNIVFLAGNIIQMNPEKYMNKFFQQVHSFILSTKLKNIDVNITNLKFLNSAGIKVIIDWIIRVTELPEIQKYTITFLCNPNSFWQETSISTLAIIDSQIVKYQQALR